MKIKLTADFENNYAFHDLHYLIYTIDNMKSDTIMDADNNSIFIISSDIVGFLLDYMGNKNELSKKMLNIHNYKDDFNNLCILMRGYYPNKSIMVIVNENSTNTIKYIDNEIVLEINNVTSPDNLNKKFTLSN